jgi:hypothetical protein
MQGVGNLPHPVGVRACRCSGLTVWMTSPVQPMTRQRLNQGATQNLNDRPYYSLVLGANTNWAKHIEPPFLKAVLSYT